MPLTYQQRLESRLLWEQGKCAAMLELLVGGPIEHRPVMLSDEVTYLQRSAQQKVRRAIRRGVLVKPNTCSKCGEETEIEAHHPDYRKPLYVLWICRPCHRDEH